MQCKCVKCTYNGMIKMRIVEEMWYASCPRCGAEYWKGDKNMKKDFTQHPELMEYIKKGD